MTTFAKYLTLTAIFTSSIFASSGDYLLLNDMKLIKEESKIVEKMSTEVTDKDVKEFSKILDGLINGDDSLNLRGTKISAIRVKLIDIREFWNSKKGSLDSSSLTKIDIEINKVIKLYAKSYNKYLQKQKLATIITQHMNQSKPDRKILALYEKF
jgi:hypothetical protein